ncbi:MAG: VWA domain-containing protein [Pirellulales bacterium]|nr:VWA domain-containing protein [Pirellulales bacterium]
MTVFLMVVIFGIVAFAVDMGCIVLARTQLQAAADSSALAAAASMNLPRAEMEAVARRFASKNRLGSRPVVIRPQDVQYGTWNTATRTFTPSGTPGNAVKVTARAANSTGGEIPLFFARIFNKQSASVQASAVATTNPRDICFVVDLSGSMNFDTDPDYTEGLNRTFAAQGYPTIGNELMQKIYNDFHFGEYPGAAASLGDPLVSRSSDLFDKNNSPLLDWKQPLTLRVGRTNYSYTVPERYQITTTTKKGWGHWGGGQHTVTDSRAEIQKKAYSWVMDVQLRGVPNFPPLPGIMPAARPTPDSTDSRNYEYWLSYISENESNLGYCSYMHFMMNNGRDRKPGGNRYTPLSTYSPDCPMHSEETMGGVFDFPPREQPTHASRRATIAALQIIRERNQTISDPNQRDWVSIITFDRLDNGGPVVLLPLTSDYHAAMEACTTFQACSHAGASTATEAGLIAAREHIKPAQEGGRGRLASNKIVVLLTDGQPNLYVSSNSEINAYCTQHPSSNYYGGWTNNSYNAALMQTAMMQAKNWYVYPVGIGLRTDYDFMDREARLGGTANSQGESPRGSGNPADYEQRLTEIFEEIITNPKLRLVQ